MPTTSHNDGLTDQQLRDILNKYKHYTVYGISAKSDKPSFKVTQYMRSKGYEIVGVNPGQTEIQGRPCYKNLETAQLSSPEFTKMINIFRASDQIPDVIDEILKLKTKPEVIWLQLGIFHLDAEAKAKKAGIIVVSNRCLHLEHVRLA